MPDDHKFDRITDQIDLPLTEAQKKALQVNPIEKENVIEIKLDMAKQYNWLALKTEFFIGDWKNVSEFLRDKGFKVEKSISFMVLGWTLEKRMLVKKITENLMEQIVTDLHADKIEKLRKKQLDVSDKMLAIGEESLSNVNVKTISASDSRKMIVAAVQIQQSASGMNKNDGMSGNNKGGDTNLTQVNLSLPKNNLDELLDGLDYEGLIKLLAELRRGKQGETGTTGVIEGEAEPVQDGD